MAIGNDQKLVLKPGNTSKNFYIIFFGSIDENLYGEIFENFYDFFFRDRTREKSEGKDRKRERSTQPDADTAKKSRKDPDDLKKDLDTLIRQEESKLKVQNF